MIRFCVILFIICSTAKSFTQEITNHIGTIIPKQTIEMGPLYTASIPGWTEMTSGAEMYQEFLTGTVRLVYDRSDFTDIKDKKWGLKIIYDVFDENASTIEMYQDQEIIIQVFDSRTIYETENRHSLTAGLYGIRIEKIFVSLDEWETETEDLLSYVKYIPKDIHLQVGIENEKYYHLSHNTVIDSNLIIVSDQANKLQISWPLVPGAEKYELQWIYHDNQVNNSVRQDSLIPIRHGPSVEVIDPLYEMYINYPPGKLKFRVRPVGRFIRNVDPRVNKIYATGWWSGTQTHLYSGFNTGNHWVAETTYAEEGKYKKQVQYFDDGLKNRQVVSTLSTDDIVLRATTHFDHEGRPVAGVLPAPDFAVPSLNFNGGFNALSRENFDNNNIAPLPINSNSGASFYYSDANTLTNDEAIHNSFIPESGGYPFTLMKYLNDGTQRLKAQSGVGPEFTIGSGHETMYFYDDPSEYQLKRLFGDDVGNEKNYLRNITQDPNKQLSVNYIDNAGRTIATALLGLSPENVQPLQSETDQVEITEYLNNKNEIIEEEGISRVITTVFTEAPNEIIYINYGVKGLSYEVGETCLGCKYVLNIRVVDPCGDSIAECSVVNLPINVNDGCAQVDEFTIPEISCPCDSMGMYTIIKELKVVELSLEEWKEILIANGELPDLSEYITHYESLIDTSNCNDACEDYCADAPDVEACIKACLDSMLIEGSEIMCDAIYQNMRLQMARGGCRYADWTVAPIQINISNAEFIYDGETILGSDMMEILMDPTIQWESSWYDTLAEFHPEYCYYTFCMDMEESRHYDLDLTIYPRWSELIADPLIVMNEDPFFAINPPGPGFSYRVEMQTKLQLYAVEIDDAGLCANGGFNLSLIELINCRMPNESNENKWNFYIGVYLGLKSDLIPQAQADVCSPPFEPTCTVRPPELPVELFGDDVDVDDALDFLNDNGVALSCPDFCEGSADYLAGQVLNLCGIEDNEGTIYNQLVELFMTHCMAVCGYQNPFGALLDEDSELPTYIAIFEFIGTLGNCNEEDVIDAISNPFDSLYIPLGEPQDAGIDIFINQCVVDTLDLFAYHDSVYQDSIDPMLLEELLGDQTYLLDTGLYYFVGYDSLCCDTTPLMLSDTAVFSWFPAEPGYPGQGFPWEDGGVVEDTFLAGHNLGMHPLLLFEKPGCYVIDYYVPTPPGACSDMSQVVIYVPDCAEEAEIVLDSITSCQVSATLETNALCPDIDTVIWNVIYQAVGPGGILDTIPYIEGDTINISVVNIFLATVIFNSDCCDTLFLRDTLKCECPVFEIVGETTELCANTERTFSVNSPINPFATYSWDFGSGAVPPNANTYGPHDVYYTTTGSKTVYLSVTDNLACNGTDIINFTVVSCQGVAGTVYNDLNSNEAYDPDEELEGITVELHTDNNTDGAMDDPLNPYATTITNPEGNFTFIGVPLGHYVLYEVNGPGYISVKDYDLSEDFDLVPNTNMNDDLLPVTIGINEIDEDNYFADACDPGLDVEIIRYYGCRYELYFENPDDPLSDYARVTINEDQFTSEVAVQCILNNVSNELPGLDYECLGLIESNTLTRPVVLGKKISIGLEDGDTPNVLWVSDGSTWHELDISYAAYEANCDCADCTLPPGDFEFDSQAPQVFVNAITQSILSAFCVQLNAPIDEEYKLIVTHFDKLEILLVNKENPSGTLYYLADASGNNHVQPIIIHDSNPLEGAVSPFIEYFDANEINSNYTWEDWCMTEASCEPMSNNPYFDDYGTWSSDAHGDITFSELLFTGTPSVINYCPFVLWASTNCPEPEFLWETGETTQYILTVEPGYYTVSVTCDGCVVEDTHFLPGSAPNPGNGDGVTLSTDGAGASDGYIFVYPNPANEAFYIDFHHNYPIQEEFTVSLYDISGKLVLFNEYISIGNSDKVKIDSSALPAGIYMVTIRDHKGVYSKAIVIVN